MTAPHPTNHREIVRLDAAYAPQVYALRLKSLSQDTNSFASTYDHEVMLGLSTYELRLSREPKSGIFGYWGIYENQRLLGYAHLSPENLPRKRHLAYIYELIIDPVYRKQGLARHLISQLISLNEHSRTVERYRLNVISTNQAAIDLYRKAGFKAIANIPHTIKHLDQYWDEIVMEYEFV